MIWICSAVFPGFEPGQRHCDTISKTNSSSSLECAWVVYCGTIIIVIVVIIIIVVVFVRGYRNNDKRGKAPHTSEGQGGSETNYIPWRFHYRTTGCKQITRITHKLYWQGVGCKVLLHLQKNKKRSRLAANVRCRADQRRELSEMASPSVFYKQAEQLQPE